MTFFDVCFLFPCSVISNALRDCVEMKLYSSVMGELGLRVIGAWLNKTDLQFG